MARKKLFGYEIPSPRGIMKSKLQSYNAKSIRDQCAEISTARGETQRSDHMQPAAS